MFKPDQYEQIIIIISVNILLYLRTLLMYRTIGNQIYAVVGIELFHNIHKWYPKNKLRGHLTYDLY